jgi:prepilin-type processing-associated H-X9-DG protein
VIALLISLLLPALSSATDAARAAACLSNLRQQRVAMAAYIIDHSGYFPNHREDEYGKNKYHRPDGYDTYWATTLLDYGLTPATFHCPGILSKQTDYGYTWSWKFDQYYIGYGYNAWFLGLFMYPAGYPSTNGRYIGVGGIITTDFLRFSRVKSPAENLCLGDKNPLPVAGSVHWGQALWWPNASDASIYHEGVNDSRHRGGAGVVYNDGHAALKHASVFNPPTTPTNPTNDHPFLRIWDPLQR